MEAKGNCRQSALPRERVIVETYILKKYVIVKKMRYGKEALIVEIKTRYHITHFRKDALS